jgi:hypothetical protein
MKLRLLLCLFLFAFSVVPQQAQNTEIDCENVEALRENLGNVVDQVESLEELAAIVVAIKVIIIQCEVEVPPFVFAPIATASATTTPENIDAVPGFTRSNPLPLGEWLEFEGGSVRVVSVVDYVACDYCSFTVPDGTRLIAVNMEYLCQKADENETCRGINVSSGSAYVTVDGIVLDEASLYDADNIGVQGHEVYPGATMTGNIYFTIPEGDEPNIMRLNIIPNQPVFLSLH